MHYLKTFFDDEGMPHLGNSLANVEQEVALYDVILDLKRALKPDLYQRLIEHSFLFAPPYYPLNYFIEIPLRPPLRIFTIMDWTNTTTQERFGEFVRKIFPAQNSSDIMRDIEQWIER
ncbi:hypothetical protein [Puia sp.]|uniref:hypothetical protein n=1 Tax=Puia sp. TaxID=2045100 RepID=UPI002F4149E5